MKILIPNTTGPSNVGDDAILAGLLLLLRECYPEAQVTIHASYPEFYPHTKQYDIKPTLYHLSVFAAPQFSKRIFRLLTLLVSYAFFPRWIIKNIFSPLLKDYKDADLIVFVGGGALRPRAGIKQNLNFFMQLTLMAFARKTKAFKVIAPISFGPFLYKWQSRIAAYFLKDFDYIFIREALSYRVARDAGLLSALRGYDHAFLLSKNQETASKDAHGFSLAFTVRRWFIKSEEQNIFERNFADALIRFAKTNNVPIQPVIQVASPVFTEDDVSSTNNILLRLKNAGVVVLPVIGLSGVRHAVEVYGRVGLLLGMRMHSNIIAATQGVPFVAVSYEYKTEGIAEDLGMQDYVIKCEEATADSLYALLTRAYDHRAELGDQLLDRVARIRDEEKNRWHNIFQKIGSHEK